MQERISIEDFVRGVKSKKENLGIGIHGIFAGTLKEKEEVAQQILQTGLKIPVRSETILSTSISLESQKNPILGGMLKHYQYGVGPQCNVIIVVPQKIQNKEGKSIFLGYPQKMIKTAGQQYQGTCVLDYICCKMGRIPSSFIYGYYTKEGGLVQNSNHYFEQSEEQREALFTEMAETMQGLQGEFYKTISELVIEGDYKKLMEMKAYWDNRGIKNYVIENAIEALKGEPSFLEKNAEKTDRKKSKGTGEDWEI